MNLEKRVEQLEHRAGDGDDFLLIVISAVGCNPQEIGADRAVHAPVAGYRSLMGDREWRPKPGEKLQVLTARIEHELQAEGSKFYVVSEIYA